MTLPFAPITPELAAANREALNFAVAEPIRHLLPHRSARPLPIHDAELIAQLAEGLTNRQIARRCGDVDQAVQARIAWLLSVTAARTRAHLVATGARKGWIEWAGTYWAARPDQWPAGGVG